MVLLAEISPILGTQCEIGLVKRKTSSVTTGGNDLMNTAFYEPEVDEEIERKPKNQAFTDEKSDFWEVRLDELTARHPILMLWMVPLLVHLLLILLITSTVYITGIAAFSDKCAARLYYFVFCCIF